MKELCDVCKNLSKRYGDSLNSLQKIKMYPEHLASKDEYQRAVNHSRRVPMGVVLSTLGRGLAMRS